MFENCFRIINCELTKGIGKQGPAISFSDMPACLLGHPNPLNAPNGAAFAPFGRWPRRFARGSKNPHAMRHRADRNDRSAFCFPMLLLGWLDT